MTRLVWPRPGRQPRGPGPTTSAGGLFLSGMSAPARGGRGLGAVNEGALLRAAAYVRGRLF